MTFKEKIKLSLFPYKYFGTHNHIRVDKKSGSIEYNDMRLSLHGSLLASGSSWEHIDLERAKFLVPDFEAKEMEKLLQRLHTQKSGEQR